jgi:hypothetical protein
MCISNAKSHWRGPDENLFFVFSCLNFLFLRVITKLLQMKLAEKKQDKTLLFKFIFRFSFLLSSHSRFVLDLDRELETHILNSQDSS